MGATIVRLAAISVVAVLAVPGAARCDSKDGASSVQAADARAGKSKAGQKRVTFRMKREGDDGPMRVEWSFPRRLANAVEGQPTEEARTAFGIGELRKQAEAGDRISEFELGYFCLYGVGVARDLGEAEARLRIGLDIARPEGAWRLAWELAYGNKGDRDMPKAADLVIGALGGGCREATETAGHLAHHFARKARPPDPRRAGEIVDAILRLKPNDEYALVLGAHLRFKRGDFDGAWEMATRALGVPGVSERNRVVARSLRWGVAQRAGKVGELEAADFREPLAYIAKKTPRVVVIVGAVAGSMGALAILGLLAFVTRSRGVAGPGIFLTVCWIAIPAVAFGLGLFAAAAAASVGVVVVVAVLLALRAELREKYFPLGVSSSAGGFFRVAIAIVGSIGLIYGIGIAYQAAFTAITGRSPDMQLVAALLRAETVSDFAMLLFVAAICIPIVEEVAFRGFLLDWLRRRFSWAWAITIGAIAFGMIHGPMAAVPTAAIGLVAGWLRVRFGNLWAPVAVHALNNGVAVILLWLGVV